MAEDCESAVCLFLAYLPDARAEVGLALAAAGCSATFGVRCNLEELPRRCLSLVSEYQYTYTYK